MELLVHMGESLGTILFANLRESFLHNPRSTCCCEMLLMWECGACYHTSVQGPLTCKDWVNIIAMGWEGLIN